MDMKIYLLFEHLEYEGDIFYGAFSSNERVEEYLEKLLDEKYSATAEDFKKNKRYYSPHFTFERYKEERLRRRLAAPNDYYVEECMLNQPER